MSDRPPGRAAAPRPPAGGGPAAPPEAHAEDAPAAAARSEAAFLMAEGDAATDKSWAACVYFEAAHVLETRASDSKAAARAYTTALSSDPTYQPTAWALRRHLAGRGHWQNLVRALDAEARFASNTRSSDRSDLWVERGWVLREQLGRSDEARASFDQATKLDPTNRAAWLALLLHAAVQGPPDDVERAFQGLMARPRHLADLASWAGAHASWVMTPPPHGPADLDPEARTERASASLLMALDAGARDPFLLALLDRVSVASPERRLQVLDWLVAPAAPHERQSHALASRLVALRERARRLFAAGDLPSAVASLDEALAIDPSHPVVVADRLDLAALEGRLDVLDQWHAHATGAEAIAELIFRRVDVALAQGAWGEAMGALRAPALRELDLEDLLFVESVRTLAALGDAQALAEAYEAQADAQQARAARGGAASAKALSEAVHLYVRAGVLWEVELADSLRAETLYGQALALSPKYRPAVEGLASVFTREGRWENLVELVAADAAAAVTSERASALRESLVLLNRDLLGDLKAALAAQVALVDGAPEDVRALYRWLDLCGRSFDAEPGVVDGAIEAVRRLLLKVRATRVRAALALLAVRLTQGTPRDAEADGWLERALAMDPTSLAAAFIERRSAHDAARVRVALQRELDAYAARSDGGDKSRALRFRLAFRALEGGWPADALSALAPLVASGDAAARAWHLDIARRARDPQIIRRALAPASEDLALSPNERAELSVLLAETLEAAGRRGEARAAFEQALAVAREQTQVDLTVRSAWGRLRVASAETDIAAIVDAQNALADALPAATAEAFAKDARHVLVATGGAAGEAGAADPVLALAGTLRASDTAFWDAAASLADALPEGKARADVLFARGLAALLVSSDEAEGALAQAHREDPQGAAAAVLTDLLGDGAGVSQPAVLAARVAQLAADAVEDPASRALLSLLALEQAAAAESEGDLAAAAAAYGLVVRWRPSSLEALEGLRRLAQLAGARRDEAALLERIGDVMVNQTAAAAHYAEAALLLEADGNAESAIRLFYKVLTRAPDDDEAFDRLRALLLGHNDWPRLERLLGFKLTRLEHKGPRCVPLWLQRARLRHEWLDDAAGAHADWQRLLRAHAHAFEAEWRLGQALRAQGAARAARKRFEAALASGEAPAAVRLGCLVDLADVCAQAGDADAAKRHLLATQDLLEHLDTDTTDRIVSLGVRLDAIDLAVRALEWVAQTRTGPARAAQLVRVGRLWRDNPGRASARARSAAAYMRAVQADAFSDAALDLAASDPLPVFTPDERRTLWQAAGEVVQHVTTLDPFDLRALELVRAYAHCLAEAFRVAMAEQILFMLGQGHVRGQSRNVAGTLTPQELWQLGADQDETAAVQSLAAVWPQLADAAAKAWLSLEPGPTVGRATRVQVHEDTRLGWLEAAGQTLGLAELTVYRVDGEATVAAVAGSGFRIAVGGGLLGGDPASRFRIGRALALLRLGAPFLIRHGQDDAKGFCVALLAAATASPALEGARDSSVPMHAARAFAKKAARALEPLASELRTLTADDIVAWLSHLSRAADRFALAVSGDVAESAFALAGSRKLESVQVSPPARALVVFSLSLAHGQLRTRLGLEPSQGPRA